MIPPVPFLRLCHPLFGTASSAPHAMTFAYEGNSLKEIFGIPRSYSVDLIRRSANITKLPITTVCDQSNNGFVCQTDAYGSPVIVDPVN